MLTKAAQPKCIFNDLWWQKTKVTAVALSEQKLKAKLKQSVLIKGSDTYKITKPVDATIVYSADKKYGVIQKEDEGNYLNRKAFYDAVEKSIESLSNTLNLTDEKKNPDVYKSLVCIMMMKN